MKHIIIVHGRHFKPNETSLKKNWIAALYYGLKREDKDKAALLKNTKISFAYHGKKANEFLRSIGNPYDEYDDIKDREVTLNKLMGYSSGDFFDKEVYENLPGKSALQEAIADAFGGTLSLLGVTDKIISSVAPDMAQYWEHDSQFGSDIRWTLTDILSKALMNDDKILLISHSLGTMIAYDTLWKFSHYGEYRDIKNKKLHTWVTLGSPLSDETVKKNLKGANLNGRRKYPRNIKKWINIAAEDDYICHDQAVENDYKEMITFRNIKSIQDLKIYNLAVRKNKSNPHHSAGYLIHPITSNILAEWLD